jgi:tetratricopeptide (TPR) repeat protein
VIDVPDVDPDILQHASAGLLELDDNAAAIACLERALELLPAPTPALLRDLAAIQQRAGRIDQSLEIIERAVQLDPQDPDLHLFKADLLLTRERPEAARACLEHALNLRPGDPEIHRRIAVVLRSQGDLVSALEHAGHMRAALVEAPESSLALAARALSADLMRAMLQPENAREMLEFPQSPVLTPDPAGQQAPLEFYCLAAELALAEEEEIAAAKAMTAGFELDPDHPRVLALQARLFYRRGDSAAARQSIQSALHTIQGSLKAGQTAVQETASAQSSGPTPW